MDDYGWMNVSGMWQNSWVCQIWMSSIFLPSSKDFSYVLLLSASGFNLTLKVYFANFKVKVRHFFFPEVVSDMFEFLLQEWWSSAPKWLNICRITGCFWPSKWPKQPVKSVQWDWDLPWWAMDVLVHHPTIPAETCRWSGGVFFFFLMGLLRGGPRGGVSLIFPKVPHSSRPESLGFPRNTPSPWTPPP